MVTEADAARLVIRVLSPASPFTDTMVMTGEPGLVASRSKSSGPFWLFCTVNVNA